MRAEPLAYRWAVLLLGVALLTSGCVTRVSPLVGSGAQGPRAMSALRATAAGSAQLETPSAFASTEPGAQEQSTVSAPEEEERLHRCYRARLLMEIWTGWLMGISEDARARITLVDGALAGRERWARTRGTGAPDT
ncbi:hypothetical protein JQX13_00055 [Archangium violaceum]|uniref:hypothetical protein n=1 Tax=Archangium violaceum TaxID=83451 RepID=UPI00193C10EA|nr:hypothetical protein [Archangium violaceum]QRK08628.1 hypothetical protein JQX13_00055 [Archangium violaceum]